MELNRLCRSVGLVCVVAAVSFTVLASAWFFVAGLGLPAERYEVPSLTVWGKVFSFLLLAALGVSALVWRRPVLYAQAVLETSPLGSGLWCGKLADWRLYLKTLLVVETLAIVSVLFFGDGGYFVSTTDTLGLTGSGAIVAFVVHLLLLHRRRRS